MPMPIVGLQTLGGLRRVPVGIHDRAARSPRRARGQALAEFALVFPIFMIMVAGIIQFGIIFWGQNTLNQIVRDTGRWAATQRSCDPTTQGPLVRNQARAIAAQSSLIGYTSWPDANIDVSWTGSPCPPQNNQQEAWVQITIRHTVPVFFPIVPGNGQISSSAEFRMEPAP